MDYGFNAALSLIVKSALPGDNGKNGPVSEMPKSGKFKLQNVV